LRNIQETVATVIGLASQEASAANPSLAPLTESFDRLVHDFHEEYVALKLEDVVVGAIGQIVS
jgi:tuftelin-interacting protein 11